MRSEFDVTKSGQGFPRIFWAPGMDSDIWIFFVQSGDDVTTYVTGIGNDSFLAASEWKGESVTVYKRTPNGGRVELKIPDARQAIPDVVLAEFDAENRLVGSDPLIVIQPNAGFMGWLEVAPGLRLDDLFRLYSQDLFKKSLWAAGASDAAISEVIAANRTYQSAKDKNVSRYVKGQISLDKLDQQMDPVSAAYQNKLVALLGADGYARLRKITESDPLISKWGSGQNAEYYRMQGDDILEYNIRRKD